ITSSHCRRLPANMEVDRISFAGRLLDILEAMSESHFISFDLELSGVPSKQASSKAKMTMEERYQDIKAAAEKYQILQIGLTCVHQDFENDTYILRPYNFNLNPLLEERLDIERIFSFQSGAAEFLIANGFRMDLPMTMGVPYLSREEAKRAKKLAYTRFERSNIEDVQLKADEVESLEFVRKVRVAITKWKADGKPHPSFLNIVSTDPEGPQPAIPRLGRFEKRLVHQLVRAEYPELITISKPEMIIIKAYDAIREQSILESKKKAVKRQIERQTGFRWIVEALCGGHLDLDVQAFARDVRTGQPKFVDMNDLRSRFGRAELDLRRRRRVLVGHNLFTDLIYFYRTFIGDLPATLSEFRTEIHKLFPIVVDTKYMATHNCGDINPASSLQQIDEQLRRQPTPLIVTHEAHQKYASMDTFHEAGFDSYLTALIMIRLSAKLDAAGSAASNKSPGMSDDEAYETASDGLSHANQKKSSNQLAPGTTAATAETVKGDSETWGAPSESSLKPFGDGGVQEQPAPSFMLNGCTYYLTPQMQREPMTAMPPFGTDFWRVYDNKLRVFGTVESMWQLDE
ncbi:CAF1-domain-containing protein, partial [Saccharata proteae CBS 121410]